MSRHPIDVLKAALQEAKTEAATLRIARDLLVKERNVVIEERNKARARVKELEQQNAVQRENVDEAMRQNTRLSGALLALVESLDAGFAEVSDAVHRQRRAGKSQHIGQTMAVNTLHRRCGKALDAARAIVGTSDNAPFRQPEPCPPSSVTGKACLLPPGHPADSPTRFHRYAGPDPEARIRELEAEVQRLQRDRAQVGAFGFKPLGIR